MEKNKKQIDGQGAENTDLLFLPLSLFDGEIIPFRVLSGIHRGGAVFDLLTSDGRVD